MCWGQEAGSWYARATVGMLLVCTTNRSQAASPCWCITTVFQYVPVTGGGRWHMPVVGKKVPAHASDRWQDACVCQ